MTARPTARRFDGSMATILALVAALAGCGGRIDEAPGSALTSPAVTHEVAPRPIVGGPLASLQPSSDGEGDPRSQLAQFRAEVAELPKRLDNANAVTPQGARTDATAVPANVDQAEPDDMQRIAASEAAFRREPLDAAWSQGNSTRVRAALSEGTDGLAYQIRSIECRSRSCRVEIAAEGVPQLAQHLPLIVSRLGSILTMVSSGAVHQGDGQQGAVLYLSRQEPAAAASTQFQSGALGLLPRLHEVLGRLHEARVHGGTMLLDVEEEFGHETVVRYAAILDVVPGAVACHLMGADSRGAKNRA